MTFDLLLREVTVVDGTGAEPYIADVAIRGDRIAAIGNLGDGTAQRIIAGDGRCLMPGFIDVHTHDDINVIRTPDMLAKISQGVTTVIVGNCGISASPVTLTGAPPDPMNLLGAQDAFVYPAFGAYADAVEHARPSVNVAALIGHTTLRANVMAQFDRPATEHELQQMCAALEAALNAGAIGLSSGLAYTNARQAPATEMQRLVDIVGAHGALYTTHMRNEHDGLLDSLQESFSTARRAGGDLVISHLKCAGAGNWGRAPQALAALEKAAREQPCNCDCYPYAASSTTLDAWRVDGKMDIFITWSEPHPEMARQTLKDIAEQWGIDQWQATERLRPAGAIYHMMSEDDVRKILAHPLSMVGSDGLPNDPNPHPRLWGTFPRVLAHYCRDLQLFDLAEAVRKMTELSAARFRLQDRGVVRVGAFADLTLVDMTRIQDVATYSDPCRQAPGIDLVMVNGVVSYQDGRVAGRQGRLLKRRSAAGEM
ncbi:N-acyl-D-amino-acid deacylase|uniref:N-acyl-D-amino-acid deacylase n=1 Tax=Brenneria salicis ATCC 15712 = DSM 30166 TaxID=714314 RepID=A0A366I5Q0_9GAMM|nr:D-aminoacylase [Brenneria salicis]NMN91890.1 N-acyl-D-amino-acid deacylase [Brenneria salicis ATCC 15712 = DSM 30166]RBP62892.1 N-acyl-D-amino-acid deacylase [Brenneria salicis ATCC 15712 = DSM 30166]RLM30756.1 D-aminoacylase [Brenneria salicis ATCC 15712 = DSM 30166]